MFHIGKSSPPHFTKSSRVTLRVFPAPFYFLEEKNFPRSGDEYIASRYIIHTRNGIYILL